MSSVSGAYGITRADALALMREYIPQDNLQKHSLASEAVLRALARRLGQDEELWGLAGLLHDLDYNSTKDDMRRHGLESAQILAARGIAADIVASIKAHNADNLGLQRQTPLDFALSAGETITGMIVAVTLVYPDKKIAGVKPSSVVKRMQEAHFARSVNRGHILLCEQLGLSLNDFVQISLDAMREVAADIGLA